MNNRTTYEELIVRKLEELPLPDFSNAIWENLEKQLDVAMPVSETIPSKPLISKMVLVKTGLGIIIALIATILIFLLLKKPIIKEENKKPAPIEFQKKSTPQTKEEKIEEQDKDPVKNIEKKPVKIRSIESVPTIIPPVKSVLLERDSLSQHLITPSKLVMPKPLNIHIPKVLKTPNITDDDYRLVPN